MRGFGSFVVGATGLASCGNDRLLNEDYTDSERYLAYLGPDGEEIWDVWYTRRVYDPATIIENVPFYDGSEMDIGMSFRRALSLASEIVAAQSMPEWQFPGFCVKFGAIETHPLRPCVEQSVRV